MAINNVEMAEAWGELLGLTPEKIVELAGLLDQWALGGARLATLARLTTDVSTFNDAAVRMVHDWYGGAADGGPNGDGLYPLMNSDAEVFLLPSPAKIMAEVSGLDPKGTLASEDDLPATGEPGDLWIIAGNGWGWSAKDNRFNNLGPFQGASALKVLIDGGVLPGGSTSEDFATWLANSQSAVIQPLVDAVEADRQAVVVAAGQVEADRQAVDAAAGQVEADRGNVAADRQAVDTAAGDVEVLRNQAQQFRNEAEAFKDQAGEIAGGNFLTEAAANGLYRKLADALGIADVAGLTAALEGKATPADITAAINALLDGAPAALDTLKELADALADSDDALAALVLALGDKADAQATAVALALKADLVGGKVPATQLTFATPAEVRAGNATGKAVDPATLVDADGYIPVTANGAFTLDFSTGRKFKVTLTANSTMSITGLTKEISGVIRYQQDAIGSRTLGVNAAIKKVGAYTLSTAPNAVDRCGVEICAGVVEMTALEKGVA